MLRRFLPPPVRSCRNLILVLCFALPRMGISLCFAQETVYFKSGKTMVVESHVVRNSTIHLALPGDGHMEVDSDWVEGFGPVDHPIDAVPSASTPASVEAARPPGRPELIRLVQASAKKFNLDESLLTSVIQAESGFNPLAVSTKGARGLMQLMPDTAAAHQVKNAFDPKENVEAGSKYLKALLEQFNQNLVLALAAYNAGPTTVHEYKGVPPFPETARYVQRVLTLSQQRD